MKFWIHLSVIFQLMQVCLAFPQTIQEEIVKKKFYLDPAKRDDSFFPRIEKPQLFKMPDFIELIDTLFNSSMKFPSPNYYNPSSGVEPRFFIDFPDVIPTPAPSDKFLDMYPNSFNHFIRYANEIPALWNGFSYEMSYRESIKEVITAHYLSDKNSSERFRFIRASFLDELKGIQYSLINFADTIRGGQAGALNVSNVVNGFQLGVVNIGGDVKGMQFGLINISDYIEGMPVGLINYSKSGIQRMICWTDNLYRYNLGVKFEVNNTYSILSVAQGNIFRDIEESISFGARYGYQFDFRHFFLGADIGYLRMDNEDYFVTTGNTDENAFVARVSLGIDLFDEFSLVAGCGLDYIWSDISGMGSGSFYGHILFGFELFANN
jgi:hypothetical protein